jgi:hypothetical protein
MGGAAALAYDGVANNKNEMDVLRHDDVCIDRYHGVMGSNGCQQLMLDGSAHFGEGDRGGGGFGACYAAQRVAQGICHMYGDVVDAWSRVVMG